MDLEFLNQAQTLVVELRMESQWKFRGFFKEIAEFNPEDELESIASPDDHGVIFILRVQHISKRVIQTTRPLIIIMIRRLIIGP